ncbi:MAG TPA: serine hydrolase domain-containing protein [Bryobacteraceae bacterium]|nr:serine hydrolase domain-containing protein [Bryobacteraceae bacterium]
MQPRTLPLALGLTLAAIPAFAQRPRANAPTNAEIRTILADRIDQEHQSVGIVVGVIDPEGRRIVSYGSLDQGDFRPLDGDSIFEIGSITKVFTSLLLAEMAQRGEVAFTDPVAKHLPRGVRVPERGGRSITLEDLATHTSGLPRTPPNLAPKDPANPFADYSPQLLYDFLSSYRLTRDIGSEWEYSNLGSGLLGLALALRAGSDYEGAVRSRITRPLGMNSTRIALTPEEKSRLAVGHNAHLAPVPNWDFQGLAGAAGLRSSANDLLQLLAAALGYEKTPLAPAMAAMLDERRPTNQAGLVNALGWQISTPDAFNIVWKDGNTGGYSSFLGYNATTRIGVAVLSNTSTRAGVNDIGMHVLDAPSRLFRLPHRASEELNRTGGRIQ